jgi:HEAT repeat protein
VAELPNELRRALEAEESGELDRLVRQRRSVDLEALRSLLLPDSAVPSDFRMKAMYALGRWGDPSTVPDIRNVLPLLNDRETITALTALGHIGTPEAASVILEFADDSSPQVRKSAAIALSRTGTPEALAKVRNMAANDPLPWVREVAGRRVR